MRRRARIDIAYAWTRAEEAELRPTDSFNRRSGAAAGLVGFRQTRALQCPGFHMSLAPGTRLGPYEIAAPIGAGGMGKVYRALDTRLGRTVAIKTINGPFSERFEREARAISALNHPHICTLHDVGTHDGAGFLVMEYVEGQPLKGPLPWKEAARHVAEVCDALDAAHRKGIVHRDLKPGNVLLTSQGVKVIDFGLAKQNLTESATVTAPGAVMGTVAYMSPEQAVGQPVDARTDLWAVGMLFYELLTGRLPFQSKSASAILAEIVDPAALALEFPPSMPAEAARVVRKLLTKEPAERYQHADDVAVDLRTLIREATQVSTPVVPVREPPAARRRFWLRVLPWALAVLVAAGLAMVAWRSWRTASVRSPGQTPSGPSRIVVFPFDNLGPPDDVYFAVGVADEIAGRLSAVGGLSVVSRSRAKQYDRRGKTSQQIAKDLDVDYLLEADVRWDRGAGGKGRVRIVPQLVRTSDDTQLWGQPFDRVIDDIFQVQSEIAEAVVERLGLALPGPQRQAVQARPTNNLEAYQAYMRGRYFAEQPHFTRAEWQASTDAYQRAVELDPRFALAWAELSKAHARLHYLRQDLSPERGRLAREALERASALAPDSPQARMARGYYHFWYERDSDAALKEFSAVANALPSGGEAREATAAVLDAKAELLRMQGRWEDSLNTYRELLRLNARNSDAAVELAITCSWMRRYPAAREYADQAIALAPNEAWPYLAKMINEWSSKGPTPEARAALESLPREHEWTPWAWFWQEVMEGRYQEALRQLDRFPEDWIDTKMWAAPDALFAAYAYDFLGDRERARASYEKARRQLEERVRKQPDDPRYHSSLGIAYAGLGRAREAIREGRKAVELLPVEKDAIYGMPHLHDLAVIYVKTGERELALREIERLLKVPSFVSPVWLKLNPLWAPLGGDARFEALLAQGK